MYKNKYSSGAAVWAVSLGILATIGAVITANNNTEQTSFITETESIPYSTTYVEDAALDYGKSVTRTAGLAGTRTNTYKVKTKGGKQTSRELVDSKVTKEPRDAVVARGTRPVWHCHDTTSFDQNPYNDNYCEHSGGTGKYVPDSEARQLDPTYAPGKFGAAYYNNF